MAVDAGSIYSEVRIALDRLKGDIQQVDAQFDKLVKQNKKQSNEVSTNWQASFRAIAVVGAAAFVAVGLEVRKATKTFADFQQSLANVQSVARATPEEFQRLRDAAAEAGETTRFTASQAADALYYLASAGFDASQSINALDGVLNLAGATQSDLAFTSEAVAAAISQFNLAASDSTRVANVFTASIQNSQATMQKLATSMQYVGPVASGLGYTLEQTAGILQILYNNGFEASTAGTALRSALADLANAASPAIAKLKDLGVSFADVDPSANSFADVLDVLKGASISAGDAMAIFGDRAGPALIKLIEAGGSEVRKYTEAVTGTNAAAEAYAVQNDTLSGSFDRLKSATQSAEISFVELFEPALRRLVDIATSAVKYIGEMPAALKVFIAVLGVGTPVVLAAGSAIAVMSSALAAAGVSLTAILGPVGLAVGLVAGLTAGIVALNGAQKTWAENEEAVKASREYNNKLLEEAQKQIDEVTSATNELTRAQTENLKTEAARQALTVGNLIATRTRTQRELNELEQQQLELAQKIARSRDTSLRAEAEQLSERRQAAETLIASLNDEIDTRNEIAKKLYETAAAAEAALDEQERLANQTEDEGKKTADLSSYLEELAEALRIVNDRQQIYGDAIDADKERIDAYRNAIDAMIKDGIDPQNETLQQLIATYNELANAGEEAQTKIGERDITALKRQAQKRQALEDEAQAQAEAQAAAEARYASEAAAAIERARQQGEELRALGSARAAYDQQVEALDALTRTEDEQRAIARENAINAARDAGIQGQALDDLIAKINEYYDTLDDEAAWQAFADNAQQYLGFTSSLLSGLSRLMSAIADQRIADLDRQMQAELEANGLAEQTTLERLQAELEAAKQEGDDETAAELEQEIEREKIKEKYERKKADIEYKAALAKWKLTLLQALADTASAAIEAAPNPFAVAAALALGALQTGIVYAQQPQPPAFQTGGLVIGGGGSGALVNVAEEGSTELLLNNSPEGRAFVEQIASAIADRLAVRSQGTTILEIDGEVVAQSTADQINNGRVRLIPR